MLFIKKIRAQIFKDITSQLALPFESLTAFLVTSYFSRFSSILERKAVDFLQIHENDRILEVGYGTGTGLHYAYEKLTPNGNGCIFGVEKSVYMHKKAEQRFILEIQEDGKIRLELSDVTHLPFPTNFFNGIFHCNCYRFWEDLPRALCELHRVLIPGGRMITALELKGKTEKMLRFAGNPDPVLYMLALERAGFSNVNIRYFEKPYCQAIFATKVLEIAEDVNLVEKMDALEREMRKYEKDRRILKEKRPVLENKCNDNGSDFQNDK